MPYLLVLYLWTVLKITLIFCSFFRKYYISWIHFHIINILFAYSLHIINGKRDCSCTLPLTVFDWQWMFDSNLINMYTCFNSNLNKYVHVFQEVALWIEEKIFFSFSRQESVHIQVVFLGDTYPVLMDPSHRCTVTHHTSTERATDITGDYRIPPPQIKIHIDTISESDIYIENSCFSITDGFYLCHRYVFCHWVFSFGIFWKFCFGIS